GYPFELQLRKIASPDRRFDAQLRRAVIRTYVADSLPLWPGVYRAAQHAGGGELPRVRAEADWAARPRHSRCRCSASLPVRTSVRTSGGAPVERDVLPLWQEAARHRRRRGA